MTPGAAVHLPQGNTAPRTSFLAIFLHSREHANAMVTLCVLLSFWDITNIAHVRQITDSHLVI